MVGRADTAVRVGEAKAPAYALKRPLTIAELAHVVSMPWESVDLRALIASDRDKISRAQFEGVTWNVAGHHEHRYVGGPPPRRIKLMQLAHEARARKHGIDWDLIDLRDVYAFHGGRCGICGEPVGLDVFTIDHIVPISRGGPHLFGNLQPAHDVCNSAKGSR